MKVSKGRDKKVDTWVVKVLVEKGQSWNRLDSVEIVYSVEEEE